MKMVSMKGTHEMHKTMAAEYSPPEYPYGLKIYLEEAQIKMLGLKELPEVGQEITMQCKAYVCSTNEHESEESGEIRSLTLQITDIGVKASKQITESEVTKTMYQEEV